MTSEFSPEDQAEIRSWPLGAIHAPPYDRFEPYEHECEPCRADYMLRFPFPARVELSREQYVAAVAMGRARWRAVQEAHLQREDGTPGDEYSHIVGALSEYALAAYLHAPVNAELRPDKHAPDVLCYHVRTGRNRQTKNGHTSRLWVYEKLDKPGPYVLVLPDRQDRFTIWSIEGWQTLDGIQAVGDLHEWSRGKGSTWIRYCPTDKLNRTPLPPCS